MSKKLELLTKHIAADRLKLSVRRLTELAAEGKFTRHRAFDPETRRDALMFDAAEIEAYQGRREYDSAPAGTTAALVTTAPRRLPLDEYDIDEPAAAVTLRPWLTIAESAEYSGLPASHLLGMIEAGELAARDVGIRPGGHWRVRRLDLDAIEGERVK